MPWFSKSFVAIAVKRRALIRQRGKLKCESFAERCIAKHLKHLGFRSQWKFGSGENGRFRADFYHPKYGIVVEIDGPSHRSEASQAYDRYRTRILLSMYGVNEVIRFSNADVVCKESRKRVIEAVKTSLCPQNRFLRG